jgi:hypothetical protein
MAAWRASFKSPPTPTILMEGVAIRGEGGEIVMGNGAVSLCDISGKTARSFDSGSTKSFG